MDESERLTSKELEEEALEEVWRKVQARIEKECYPLLYRWQKDGAFVQGWGFRSLLGAMYLQMMWLMIAGDNVGRCRGPGCFRIITFEKPDWWQIRPTPRKKSGQPYQRGPYKTRKDKEFCGDNCKVKWHYHFGKNRKKSRKRSQA